MTDTPPKPIRFGDLGIRLVSGLVLGAIVFIDVWLGGAWATALVAVLLVVMLWELNEIVTSGARTGTLPVVLLILGGAAATVATASLGLAAGFACLAAGGLAAGLLVRPAMGWLLGGAIYMGGAMCTLLVLRAEEPFGFALIFWLVAVVVAADVGAYFTGRTFGGPKLCPRVSPGKTWSGAFGGLGFALVAGLVFAIAAGWSPVRVTVLSLGVAIASQLGDLLESALKRRFGVKDAGRLIPGHGGVMDRLDGIMGAAWFFLIYRWLGFGLTGV